MTSTQQQPPNLPPGWLSQKSQNVRWQAASKTTPRNSHLLVFISLCNPLPLSTDWTSWLTSNESGKSDGMWILRLGYEETLAFSLPPCDGSQVHVVSSPMERPTWQETEGGLSPACEKLEDPANTTYAGLEVNPPQLALEGLQSLPTPDYSLWETLSRGLYPNSQKLWNLTYLFKVTNLGVICYTTMDNELLWTECFCLSQNSYVEP